MGHKHEIDIYELINKSENMSDGEKLSLFQTKLERYACMLDLIQGEYEKAYLELRRANGLPVISDTIFDEDIPEGARPVETVAEMPEMPVAETMAESEPAFDMAAAAIDMPQEMPAEMTMDIDMSEMPVDAMPMEEVSMEMEMPAMEMVPEPEPVVEPTIAEQAESILESIDAIIPAEAIEPETVAEPAVEMADAALVPIAEEIAELAAEMAVEPEMPVMPEAVEAVAEPEVPVVPEMPEMVEAVAEPEVPVVPEAVEAVAEPEAPAAPMPDLATLEGMDVDPALIAQAFEQATAQA